MSEYQVHLIDINSSVVISLSVRDVTTQPRGSLGANDDSNLARKYRADSFTRAVFNQPFDYKYALPYLQLGDQEKRTTLAEVGSSAD